jgi:hypothetical protein
MKFSIILPYLSRSRSINLCKQLLQKNTINEYELIEIVDSNDVYDCYNEGMRIAKTDMVIMMSDDMYVSPGWDVNYCKYHKPDLILTGFLVESGAIAVSHLNLEFNCGLTPETFDYEKFLSYVSEYNHLEEIYYDQKGWYQPIAFNRNTFVPFPNEIKFPHAANDITLIDEILPNLGFKFAKVKSFVYHLQAFTTRGS